MRRSEFPGPGHLVRFGVLILSAGSLLATGIAFAGEWHWFADLFAHLRPQYCIGLGLAAVLSVILKCRVALALAITGLIANGVVLAPFARSPLYEGNSVPGSRIWTFASVNLLHGNREVELVTRYLRNAQADIVLFQEISPRWAASLEQLSELYPYRYTQPRKDNFGVAIFSREKPEEVTIQTAGNRPGDLAVFAFFKSEGGRFGVAGVHPDKPDEEWKTENRRIYLGQVAEWSVANAQSAVPTVVTGDFNATPWSTSLRKFAQTTELRNANQGTIFGATWNVWQPHRLLIDHTYLSSQWALIHHEIGPDIGSDHRPILTRAALR